MRVVVSEVIERHYELLSLDLDTMHGKAARNIISKSHHVPSYFLLCERCHDKQPLTVEFID